MRFSRDVEDQSELEYDVVSVGKQLTIEAENFSETPASRLVLQDLSLRQCCSSRRKEHCYSLGYLTVYLHWSPPHSVKPLVQGAPIRAQVLIL